MLLVATTLPPALPSSTPPASSSSLAAAAATCTGKPTFVHIPKDGGCTVLHLLEGCGAVRRGSQADPHVAAEGCDGEFAVLREPVHRFESWLKYSMAAHPDGHEFPHPVGESLPYKLDDIFDAIAAEPDGFASLHSHFRPQTSYLRENTRLACHPDEVPQLLRDMGLSCDVKEVDHANEHGSDSDDHLSSDRAARLRDAFAEDAALWRKHCGHRDEWLQSSSRGYPDRPANLTQEGASALVGCGC